MAKVSSFRLALPVWLCLALAAALAALVALPPPVRAAAPEFYELTFATGFDEVSLQPIGAADRFDYGLTRLVVVARHRNADPEEEYQGNWFLDGDHISGQTYRFETQAGVNWYSLDRDDGEPIDAGTIRFELTYDGEVVAAIETTVQDESPAVVRTVRLEGLTFAPGVDDQAETPTHPGDEFPYDARTLYAFWDYSDLAEDTEIEYVWYFDSDEFQRGTETLPAGSGPFWVDLQYALDAPLAPGRYDFEVLLDGQSVLSGGCTVLPPGAPDYGPVLLSVDYDEGAREIANPGVRFGYGTERLYARWTYAGVTPGAKYVISWWQGDSFFGSSEETFPYEAGVEIHYAYEDSGGPLKPGPYLVRVTVGDDIVLTGQAIVEDRRGSTGSGQDYRFGRITLGSAFDPDLKIPADVSPGFAPGIQRLYAYFEFEDVSEYSPYSWRWFRDDEQIEREDAGFDYPAGAAWTYLEAEDSAGLSPGVYRVEIVHEDVIVLSRHVRLAGRRPPPPSSRPGRVQDEGG